MARSSFETQWVATTSRDYIYIDSDVYYTIRAIRTCIHPSSSIHPSIHAYTLTFLPTYLLTFLLTYLLTYLHTNAHTDRDRQTDRQTDRRTDGRTDGRADGRAGGRAGRPAGRQADRQTGRQADRQTMLLIVSMRESFNMCTVYMHNNTPCKADHAYTIDSTYKPVKWLDIEKLTCKCGSWNVIEFIALRFIWNLNTNSRTQV